MTSRHVTCHTIFEFANEAWILAFAECADNVVDHMQLPVITTTAEFRRELFVGESVWEVTPIRVGTTSLTLGMKVWQAESLAVELSVVLVQTDPQTSTPRAFDASQRETLETWAQN